MKTPNLTSKFFAIGTSGPTVDGREIKTSDIDEMAETYDAAEYAAVINVEHYRGWYPSEEFGNYGTVVALKAKTDKKGRRVLYAKISPHPNLLKLNALKQKIFTSMEIRAKFADTDKAYLVGLALTDSPASLGTEALCFSANNGGNAPDRFKDNLFSTNFETEPFTMKTLETNKDNNKPDDANKAAKDETTNLSDGNGDNKLSFLEKITAKFKKEEAKSDIQNSDMEQVVTLLADNQVKQDEAIQKLNSENEALKTDLTALKTQLENTPENLSERTPATGEDSTQTDC